MTTLTPDDIAEFQRICEAEDGVTLTKAEAEEAAKRVIRLYAVLLRPTPTEIAARKRRKRGELLMQLVMLPGALTCLRRWKRGRVRGIR